MQTVLIGEIGLSGEIRPVNDLEKRLNEAQKLGFKRAIIPAANNLSEKYDNIEVISVKRILDAITAAITQKQPVIS